MIEEKIYFMPGDIVTIKQNIPNRPTMLVIKKEVNIFKNKDEKEPILRGIKCRWFTTQLQMQEAIFNTKDLIKL